MAVKMLARFNSKCSTCAGFIDRGSSILYDRATKTAAHETCPLSPTEAALLVFLLTPATRAFLDANDPKSVDQARRALIGVARGLLLKGEASFYNTEEDTLRGPSPMAGRLCANTMVTPDGKPVTIFDDVAPFVELTDPRVAPVAAAEAEPDADRELALLNTAVTNARAASDEAAVKALEELIAARTADTASVETLNPAPVAPAPAPAPAPRAPAAPAMGSGNNIQRGRRVARGARSWTPRTLGNSPAAPAAKSTKVERDDLPF